ncbi:MAG: hypothetical protein ACOX4R_08800 [Lentihominibacter sp.]|jgi:hypothetical protein
MSKKNVELQFDINKCCDRATERFVEDTGVGNEGDKYDRMHREAFEIRKLIEPRIDVKGLYRFYDDFSLEGQVLKVHGRNNKEIVLKCTAFEQIDPDTVEGVYFYAVTAGDYYLEDMPIMKQLYADIWGTAFTDATRGILMEQLKAQHPVSDSFGPGFYGMDVSEMHKMPELVDFESLGMEVRESSVILPLKSCAGIIFKVNEGYKELNRACELCFGNKKTCTLCSVRKHII